MSVSAVPSWDLSASALSGTPPLYNGPVEAVQWPRNDFKNGFPRRKTSVARAVNRSLGLASILGLGMFAAPKKLGRPKGSKDSYKRMRRT